MKRSRKTILAVKTTYDERAKLFANYMVEHKASIRELSRVYGVSKSSVYDTVTKHLKEVDHNLWIKCKKVLHDNKIKSQTKKGELLV